MERWPWPKSYWIKNHSMDHNLEQCPSETMTAVKLVLWPSTPAASIEASEQNNAKNNNNQPSSRIKPKRMWSKLPPLRQIPKMNWLGSAENNGNVKQNAVFRSNSFRFERPPPEDDARMYSRHYKGQPVKSYSITAQDVSNASERSERVIHQCTWNDFNPNNPRKTKVKLPHDSATFLHSYGTWTVS